MKIILTKREAKTLKGLMYGGILSQTDLIACHVVHGNPIKPHARFVRELKQYQTVQKKILLQINGDKYATSRTQSKKPQG